MNAAAKKLDELADDSSLSQHLDYGKDEISGSYVLFQLAGQPETDHFGQDHGDGLAEHNSFGLNTADAPTGHPQTVDHSSVGVSSYQRIGVNSVVLVDHGYSSQVLEVDLMDNSGSRRYNREVLKGALAPFEELESFVVSGEFDFFVFQKCIFNSGDISLNRVVDNQINGDLGVDVGRVFAQTSHRVSHSGKVDYGRHSCEVLKDDSGWFERDFYILVLSCFPTENFFYVVFTNFKFIAITNGRF